MSSKNASATLLDINTAKPSSVRAVNRSIILTLIRRRQPVSRAELARLTGIFRSSVSAIVDELLMDGLVTEEQSAPSQRGRAPIRLRLNDLAHRVLGLNLRPAYCQVATAGLSGNIEGNLSFATPVSPAQLIREIGKTVTRLRKQDRQGGDPFRAIGVAVPGHVDVNSGRISWTPTHPELNGFPLTEEIERATGIQAIADNDCNAGALSELWLDSGEPEHRRNNFTFLNISDFGVGAGVVMHGELYRGHDSRFAAEVGHMIVSPSGPLCRCGRRGCWELFVSNEATWHRLHPRIPFAVERFSDLLTAADAGDDRALAVFEETAKYLSIGISNIAFAFNPAEIVVAGRITAIWNIVRDITLRQNNSSHLRYAIRPAQLSGDDSLLHGAVCLALHSTFARPRFGEVLTGQNASV